MDAATFRELQGMLAAKRDVAPLTPIEARLSEVLSSLSPSTGKRLKRHRLMDEEEEYDDTWASQTFSGLGLSLLDVPVKFDGVKYPSIMNAFQAQKAPEDDRDKYTTCTSAMAVEMGRHESIDIKEWDHGKYDLMSDICHEFISQHPTLQKALLETDVTHFREYTLSDNYWPSRIPAIWLSIKGELQSS